MKETLREQELKKLISPDLSPESFIELGVAKKLMNEFHETCVDIGDACKCAIERLLQLNRVDDAATFLIQFQTLSNSFNVQKKKCLELQPMLFNKKPHGKLRP